jgi:hypothetical protein
MKYILFLLSILILIPGKSQTDNIPRLEKMSIPECNCSVYMPKGTLPFSKAYSEDSSLVFTSDYITEDNFSFVAITVKFKQSMGTDKVANEQLLCGYMDYIKSQLAITASAGYGKGHTLEKYPDALGVLDYCSDEEGFQYAMKGWINENNLAILYIVGTKDYPHFNLQQMFLDGFRFE